MREAMAHVSKLVGNDCAFRTDGFMAIFLLESEADRQSAEKVRADVEQVIKRELLNFGMTPDDVLRVVVHFETRQDSQNPA